MEKINFRAKKIWAENNIVKNDWVVFRKKLILDDFKEKVTAKIAVDTKYYLYINDELVVFEGGLNWGPFEKCGYCDVIDFTKHLKKGENVITLLCWYWGNEGRNNVDSKSAGLLFEAEEIGIFSDESFEVFRHPSYYNTKGEQPAYLYGGYNIGFDARKDVDDTAYDFKQATVYESQNDYYVRPIPQIKYSDILSYQDVKVCEGKVIAKLPFAAQITPYFEVMAKGGEKIDIRTDRYAINGGPGDDTILYNGHRVEYICKKGINKFEALNWLFGEQVIYTVPNSVQITKLGYRESGYQTEFIGDFKCNNTLVNKLMEKCKRTLYVCMRDNFMDCPDRERGQWIGDVSVQVPQVFFTMDENAVKLVQKAIHNFISLRKGNVLVGNVPGANFSELPSQSLNAISELGMIAKYYKYTQDEEILPFCFEPIIEYLRLWNIEEDGLISKRIGDWYWFDHLYNIDEKVLENAWYYSVLSFAEIIANQTNDHKYDDFIKERKDTIKENFNKHFWKGCFYSSGGFVDDRANALAVLSGIASKEKFANIRKILVSIFNSTTYMEAYTAEALIKMGYIEDALKRMLSRYYNLIENENTTLWEDFYIKGTKNHAWSGSPLTLMFQYFAGIDTNDGFKNVVIKPDLSVLSLIECELPLKGGTIKIEAQKMKEQSKIKITNYSTSNCVLILNAKSLGLKQINRVNNENVICKNEYNIEVLKGEYNYVIG